MLGIRRVPQPPAFTRDHARITVRTGTKPPADLVANPGDGFAEGRATTHWAENTGKVPAVWIAVDIPKP